MKAFRSLTIFVDMIGIVDYRAGNIRSVGRALEAIKAQFIISDKPHDLEGCDKLIFPGVGEAKFAMEQLKKSGFDIFLKDQTAAGKKLMGICLGSQIIFDCSEEGETECLGLVKGSVRHFSSLFNKQTDRHADCKIGTPQSENALKIPHIGWNNIEFMNGSMPLLDGISDNSDFYFVHSYVICPENVEIVKAAATYGVQVPSVIEYKNISAFQFHPEKSGENGLRILRNFCFDGAAKC